MKLKKWSFYFVSKNGIDRFRTVKSKHLNGAVRKLLQEQEVWEIKKIMEG